MSEQIKLCPFCGKTETAIAGVVRHTNGNCPAWGIYSVELWNSRSIEDALNKRISELEHENSRLREVEKELTKEKKLSDALYLLLVDNLSTKKLADEIIRTANRGKNE